jgi:hypothetical protein
MMPKTKSSLILVLFLLCFLAYAIYQNNLKLRNQGKVYVVGIAAYEDQPCTIKATSIDWGDIYAGDSKNRTLYFRNEGNLPVNLTYYVDNWSPPQASNILSVSWNYLSGTVLSPAEISPIAIILTSIFAELDFSSFSFDITIEAISTASIS